MNKYDECNVANVQVDFHKTLDKLRDIQRAGLVQRTNNK